MVNENKMLAEKTVTINKIWGILQQVPDPEIPVLSVLDLGIVRDVLISSLPAVSPNQQAIEVIVTPTYSGCPAIDVIVLNIRMALLEKGYENTRITRQLSPAWTTDWITEEGRDKLRSYGIAAPVGKSIDQHALKNIEVECPQCHSNNTRLLSEFGSTACKALYKCNDCQEPFDYFKCH